MDYKSLGMRIRKRRKAMRMTQEELAKKLGLSLSFLGHIERAGWDMVECFVTAPMVPLTLAEARAAWGNRVIIWGGLPSLLLAPSVPEDEFRAYMRELLRVIAPGDAFILGIADNAMPDSLIDRVAWVSELLAKQGGYPLP